MPDLEQILRAESHVVINYRHIPAPAEIEPAIVTPDHAAPIPGGINAELNVTWTAKTPILVGGQKGQDNVLRPQRLYPGGPFCLPGASLRGMIKAAYMVATNSAFTPLNKLHKILDGSGNRLHPRNEQLQAALKTQIAEAGMSGEALDKARQEYAVTRLKIFEAGDSYTEAIKAMSSISDVAARTYGAGPVLDWATALFGFVKDEVDEKAWSRPIDFPSKALKSRVEFGFAVADLNQQAVWPSSYISIPGAGPKVTFEAGYLTNPDNEQTGKLWDKDSAAKLAGLKVYPVFQADNRLREALEQLVNGEGSETHEKLQFATKSRAGSLTFRGQIHCHNLDPLEFGALIWAITLGEAEALTGRGHARAQHLHNIGHLKAYGMGLVEVNVPSGRVDVNPTEDQPEGQPLVDRGFKEFCVKKMQGFLDFELRESASANRARYLQYKNPQVGNELRSAGFLKPIPGTPPDNMAELGQAFRDIRLQRRIINEFPFVPPE